MIPIGESAVVCLYRRETTLRRLGDAESAEYALLKFVCRLYHCTTVIHYLLMQKTGLGKGFSWSSVEENIFIAKKLTSSYKFELFSSEVFN